MSSNANNAFVKGKVVFVGDSSVGKTSIINYINSISGEPLPTVGANSNTVNIEIDKKLVTLNVWDTAGQENFQCLVPLFARCSHVAVVVYDSSNYSSFTNIDKWLNFIREDSQVPHIIIVGNKADLDPVVSPDQVKDLKNKYDLPVFITSAATGHNIDHLFTHIAELVDNDDKVEEIQRNQVEYVVNKPELAPEKKKSCC